LLCCLLLALLLQLLFLVFATRHKYKYKYGLRLPVLNYKFVEIDEPESGDVVVFRWPPEPNIDYIKRIVGVPGDHIEYIDKQLIINGQPLEQEFIDNTSNIDGQGRTWRVEKRLEKLNDEEYYIYVRPDVRAQNFEVTVPPGHYFVIGDNRDDSSDSRYWGFVPEENLVGKAFIVWMSWNKANSRIRWQRIGNSIN